MAAMVADRTASQNSKTTEHQTLLGSYLPIYETKKSQIAPAAPARASAAAADDLDKTKVVSSKTSKKKKDHHVYGPDGMPLEAGATVEVGEDGELHAVVQDHQKVEITDQGWFQAESNRFEQEQLAQIHLQAISQRAAQMQMQGMIRDGRWVNDPNVFDDLGLVGSMTSNPVVPFPPYDQQYFIRGVLDKEKSHLRRSAIPFGEGASSSDWIRLVDFAPHSDAAHLFDEFSQKNHCGKVFQGALDNGYFVEALQAISMRPKLVKQLFYCWDTRRSIYIARIFKHGTWMRVEVDDLVPVGQPVDEADPNVPICSRSEYFPSVLWPSLIEKAYAKVHTLRGSPTFITPEDRGGWEALGAGGRVEEALADLTGGVAGRFLTWDVTPDRLFIYIHDFQRDTLFVARPNEANCTAQGVRLNPYYPYVINRAVTWEGGCYIQMFSGGPGVFDGGLQDINVPYSLVHCEDYPETTAEGFFWVTAGDFHEYFETVFECRLVNSGDVSIPNMPPPRWHAVQPFPSGSDEPAVLQHKAPDGSPLAWYEFVYANPGEVGFGNQPEFTIQVPEKAVPCEIVCSIEQIDPRIQQIDPHRKPCVPILVKAYEEEEAPDLFRKELVCRSNWLNVRDAMVSFTVNKGCLVNLVAEFPDTEQRVGRMIFRCYASRPYCQVTAAPMTYAKSLVEPIGPPKATRSTLVGLMVPDSDTDDTDKPIYLDEHDAMRKAEWDLDPGWKSLADEVQKDCSIM
eukprot:TRINITY_DN6560_c0_g2_i2.p1 TRINITY_DN6560_c0_g2~~TRINITY_DN6560_c0_g2_i2.p1  ORF type:complete len:738 (+),score=137.29 TRINITY_DN6560_c0_g2_i2:63-2276(+)